MFITKSRHEREMRAKDEADYQAWQKVARERDEFEAKFKKAITDLEGEIRDRKKAQYDLALARLEVEALRPGHEANERRLKRDREQKAAKRAAKAPVKGAGK